MENLFLSQFPVKLKSYLKKHKVDDVESLRNFITDCHGNVTVGFSKILKSLDYFSRLLELLEIKEPLVNISELKIFLTYGSLTTICPVCGKQKKAINKYCSLKCNAIAMAQDLDIVNRKQNSLKQNWQEKTQEEKETTKQSRKNAFLKKYGVDHNWKVPEIRASMKLTFIKNYGVDNPMKRREISDNMKSTNMKKYGSNCPLNDPEIKRKSEESLMLNWGVKNPMHNKDIVKKNRESINESNIRKWGFINPHHNPTFKENWMKNFNEKIKHSFSYKDYKFPSGKLSKVQGYEPILIDDLLTRFEESDIVLGYDIVKLTGKFEYVQGEIMRNYVPDVYITSENCIYEVKSEWTLIHSKDTLRLKIDSCIRKGMNFILCLIKNKEIKYINHDKFNEHTDLKDL